MSSDNALTTNNINQKIQQWLEIDRQMKIIQEQQKRLREHKYRLNEDIYKFMESTNNDKIRINNETLGIYKKKEYSPLTFNYIQETLSKICSKPETVQHIIKTLKDNRNIKIYNDIRRG